jgi:Tol biopolymer transport system component
MGVDRRIIRRTCTTSLFLACLIAPSCSTETTPTEPNEPLPTSGSLELTIEETGPRPDTDGYDVSITLATQVGPVVRTLPQGGGSLLFSDLPLGTHVLRVAGLASHCSVIGNHPLAFKIEAGATAHVALGVFCPGPGAILVSTVTLGRDVPMAGYGVSITGDFAMESSIGTTDSLVVGEEELPAGAVWFVELTGVPDNCWTDRPPQAVRNLRGATVRLEYTIVCIPRSSQIAYEFVGGIYLTGGANEVSLGSWVSLSHGPSLSPDRSRIVFSSDPETIDFVLAVVDADGSGFSWLTSYDGGSYVGSQAWSPDGSRIVFWKQSGSSSDIYVMNADGSGEVRLTFAGWNTHPAWSPDGESIAFCRVQGDPDEDWPDIYRMSAIDGSGLTRVAQTGCAPAWSPDGSRIAFTQLSFSGPVDLAVIRADGSGLTRLHPGTMTPAQASRSPSWSPDGSLIAYTGGAAANRLWIVEFDGSDFREAFPYRFGTAPSWR